MLRLLRTNTDIRSLFVAQVLSFCGLVHSSDDLQTASLMFGALWGAMLAIGAALGGIVANAFGRNTAFLANAASFVLAAGLISLIRTPDHVRGRILARDFGMVTLIITLSNIAAGGTDMLALREYGLTGRHQHLRAAGLGSTTHKSSPGSLRLRHRVDRWKVHAPPGRKSVCAPAAASSARWRSVTCS